MGRLAQLWGPNPTPVHCRGFRMAFRSVWQPVLSISSVPGTELVLGIETGVRCIPALKKISLKVETDTLSSQLYMVFEKCIRGLTLELDCLSLNLDPSPSWL